MQKTHLPLGLALLCLLFCLGCSPTAKPVNELSGEAWGTTYQIKIIADDTRFDAQGVSQALQATLREVDLQLSNWNPDSEVSRFNQAATDEVFKLSPVMNSVIDVANQVHTKSDGFLDISLTPVIELWGFGATRRRDAAQPEPPSDDEVAAAMALVGQSTVLEHDASERTLRKAGAGATVFLSALAKGAGIDAIDAKLRELGFDNYLIEVGGDLIASGAGPSGEGWRIAIEQPVSRGRAAGEVVALAGQAMATSGDYRNYFERGGVRYSHIINPLTGRPVAHRTASVTVLSDKAVYADAWATALLAAGVTRGLEIAERENIAALFISRVDNTLGAEFESVRSSQFERRTAHKMAQP